ncbi:MAG: flavodoxin family protein [Actinomycetota bacterium]|nr:flavodoxin family protein [Actinomycetota bacterium]
MKVLVAYFSQTGKTRKVAEAIYESIEGERELKELGEVESLEGYDLSFIGFPIIAFGPAKEGREFLEQKAAGKKVALFVTHAAPEDQEGIEAWLEKCREAAALSDLMGFFDCQGELSQAIADALLKSDDPRMRSFGERRGETVGQPDETRLQRARDFAREVMAKVAGR